MNRYLLILGFWALAVLGGCTRSEVQGEGDSWVELSAVADPSLNIKSTKADSYTIPLPADYRYTVRHAGDKTVVAQGESIAELGTLALMAGNYQFEVASVGEASLAQPSYAGSTAFAVQKGKTAAVEVKAKLASAVVEVRFSDAVRSGFSAYQATISAQGVGQTALFDGSTPEGKLVYLPAPATQITCAIRVVTNQGFEFQTTQTVDALAAADLLSWTVDVPNYTEKPTDPLVLELALDRTLNEEQKNFTVPLTPSATGVPTITGRLIDLSQPVGVKYQTGTEAKIDLSTKGGLAKVLVMFRVGQKPIAGQSPQGLIDLLAMSEQERTAWGIVFREGGTVGATHSLLDLSAMTAKMPGSATDAENFYLTIGLLDNNGAYVTREAVFNVYGVSLTTLNYLYADRIDWFGEHGPINRVNVRLQGQYNVDDVPDGLAFQYRKVGQQAWQVAEPTINTTTKAVYATVPLLADGSTWEYRLSSTDENGETKQLPALPIYPTYTNMSFDMWSGGDLDNPTGWGSPNTSMIVNVITTTRQTPRDPQKGGYSARIQSIQVPLVGIFASGGLFTGSMPKAETTDSYKSAHVGQPFVGRPAKLIGYYKYKPATINKIDAAGMAGNGAVSGQLDRCEIAIKLEKWGVGDYKVRWRDGFFGKPGKNGKVDYLDKNGQPCDARVSQVIDYDGNDSKAPFSANIRDEISVGYGQLSTNRATNGDEWVPFEITINYSKNELPDHIIITAVSSAYGGYMSGAVGSELWVDDLEFVY